MTTEDTFLDAYPKTVPIRRGQHIVIRLMRPDDTEGLRQLFADVDETEYRVLRDDVSDPNVIASWTANIDLDEVIPLVAELDGRIVGDIRLHRQRVAPYEKIGEIRFYVHPRYRKRGIGKALVREILHIAREVGLEKIVVEFYVEHRGLITAFERMGFEREAILPTYQVIVLSYDLTRAPEPERPSIAHADHLPPLSLWPHRRFFGMTPERYPDRFNLCEILLDAVVQSAWAERPAVLTDSDAIPYDLLLHETSRLAGGLRTLGVHEADPVLMYLPNIPQAVAANFAVQRLGAVSVPVPPQLSRREMGYIIRDSGTQVAITSADLLPELLRSRGAEHLQHIVVVGNAEDLPEGPRIVRYAALVAQGQAVDPVRRSGQEVALLLYTSREDGRPKGTAHLLEEILSTVDIMGMHLWHVNEDDLLASPSPLGLGQGFLTWGIIPYRFGAAAYLLPSLDGEALLDALRHHPITILNMVPTGYRRLLELETLTEDDLASLRLCIASGEALTVHTYRAWYERFGFPILEAFATTEMLGQFLSNAVEMQPRPGSLGRPVPGYEVRIVDKHGRELPEGEIGFLVVRGPTGTLYWNDPQAQEQSVWHGWNVVGDYAYRDEDGYFWYVARQDDLIKSGGFRIDPLEVEWVLREHPAVVDAAVVGLPDPIRGQVVHAFVVPKPGVEANEALAQTILGSLHGRLAEYKIPTSLTFIESVPRGPDGKLIRRMLRERVRLGHDRIL